MFGHDLIDTAANWSRHGKCHTVTKVHPWTREIKIRSTIASGGMATLDNGKAEETNAVLLQRSRAPLKNRSCRESLLLQAMLIRIKYLTPLFMPHALISIVIRSNKQVGVLVASETVLVSKYCATGELREQRITLSLDHFSLITGLNLA
ncbi:Proline--tRNA ligase [Trichinella spiralis]|uniref:Proline--tRNA ligase n=1 Tax=Trichinella spiralis TaxID=6334 RepID=A0ABR3K5K9_TRISP